MLHLIIGPMFSGKTFHCIRQARRYRSIGKKVLFVNHRLDQRYCNNTLGSPSGTTMKGSHTGYVTTHDGDKEESLILNNLSELLNLENIEKYKETDVLIIEEAQFFPDLFDFVSREADFMTKDYIVCGLSGDYQRKPFGEILSLIPFADSVEKLNGLCNICNNGALGNFTKRKLSRNNEEVTSVGSKQSVILVGGTDLYICVCRRHFIEEG